jgi:hypothetical protein
MFDESLIGQPFIYLYCLLIKWPGLYRFEISQGISIFLTARIGEPIKIEETLRTDEGVTCFGRLLCGQLST